MFRRIPFLGRLARQVYERYLLGQWPRPRRQSRPQPGGLVEIETASGHRMLMEAEDRSVLPRLAYDGFWEDGVTRRFCRLLRAGANVIDIGANAGYYTLLAAGRVGPGGRVFAFDAHPRMVELLGRSLSINGLADRVELVNAAVADRAGRIGFNVLRHYAGNSSIAHTPDPAWTHGARVERIEVPCVSLDGFFRGREVRIDVIKMDAEGSEPLILEGMGELLARCPAVRLICEFNPLMIRQVGGDPTEYLLRLRSLGLELRVVTATGRCPTVTPDELAGREASLYLARPSRLSTRG
ncbi:MAG: hypothetical protein BIFFINMI_04318 [Phycisphaerae bacterium]|nr:hypothetical protein [Phycisphaerae bacterium]